MLLLSTPSRKYLLTKPVDSTVTHIVFARYMKEPDYSITIGNEVTPPPPAAGSLSPSSATSHSHRARAGSFTQTSSVRFSSVPGSWILPPSSATGSSSVLRDGDRTHHYRRRSRTMSPGAGYFHQQHHRVPPSVSGAGSLHPPPTGSSLVSTSWITSTTTTTSPPLRPRELDRTTRLGVPLPHVPGAGCSHSSEEELSSDLQLLFAECKTGYQGTILWVFKCISSNESDPARRVVCLQLPVVYAVPCCVFRAIGISNCTGTGPTRWLIFTTLSI